MQAAPALAPTPSPPAPGPAARHAFHDRLEAMAFASRWRETRRWVYVACDLVHTLLLLLLWQAGYPAGRLAIYAAALAASVALHVLPETAWARRREAEGNGRARDHAEFAWLAMMLLEIAVTGGVRSPLFPSNLLAIPVNLIQFGKSRTTIAASIAILACAAAFLLVPSGWTGPTAPGSIYWLVLAAAVLTTGSTSAYYWALLNRSAVESARESLRARDELATHALSRARELEQLVSKISHELKNPLAAVKTLVQVSARAAGDPANRVRLEVVEREVTRIQHTLQDYLTLSRPLDHLAPEPVRLGALVDDVLASLAGRADEAGVALQRRGDAELFADRRRICEALLNLVMNAIEASPAGGAVVVELSSSAGQVRISITDRGRGMAHDVLARVGTPFFTTRDGGTGLGVTLARAAFVQHGGTLVYASDPGVGTTATATLPSSPSGSPEWRAS